MMNYRQKFAAMRGDRRMQKRWLSAEVEELMMEKPYSEEWVLELLDVAGVCAKWALPLPSDVRDVLAQDDKWVDQVKSLYPLWLERKAEKGYQPLPLSKLLRILL